VKRRAAVVAVAVAIGLASSVWWVGDTAAPPAPRAPASLEAAAPAEAPSSTSPSAQPADAPAPVLFVPGHVAHPRLDAYQDRTRAWIDDSPLRQHRRALAAISEAYADRPGEHRDARQRERAKWSKRTSDFEAFRTPAIEVWMILAQAQYLTAKVPSDLAPSDTRLDLGLLIEHYVDDRRAYDPLMDQAAQACRALEGHPDPAIARMALDCADWVQAYHGGPTPERSYAQPPPRQRPR
jgi:hypothetical protein